MRVVIFVAAALLINFSTQAMQFSIVSGDVHAQASLSGVPPTTDTPPDIALSPATPQGSVVAHVSEPVPGVPLAPFLPVPVYRSTAPAFPSPGTATATAGRCCGRLALAPEASI
jgi:hypothetical protein